MIKHACVYACALCSHMHMHAYMRAMVEQMRACTHKRTCNNIHALPGRGFSWSIGSGQSLEQRADLEDVLSQLGSSIDRHGGPFLMGDRPSLADILIYPFMRRFEVRKCMCLCVCVLCVCVRPSAQCS